MKRSILTAAALLSLLPAGLVGQDLVAVCRRAERPPVGAWSEFKVVGGRDDGATVRLSIVGSERQAGTDYLWLEVMMRGFPMGGERQGGSASAPRMISKSLVQGLGPAASGGPRATVFKFGDNPAMEMPATEARMTPHQGPNLQACRNAKVVGWESVKVPAGTFRAIHVTETSGGHSDEWVVPDLPFAIVKTATKDGEQWVLVGHGRGARSQITERPHPWDPQLFMRMMAGARSGGRP